MTQREAERPAGMNLDWHSTGVGTWKADLPAIPGYTGADGNGSFVTVVYNGQTELAVPYDADCTIFLSQGGVVNLNLWDMWAFDPFGPDAKDVMQAVDDLGVSDISDELKRMGYEPMIDDDGDDATASRHATRRTASLDLDWKKDDEWNEWYANLPAIPGYPGTRTEGNAQIGVQPDVDGYYFNIYMINIYDNPPAGVNDVYLYNRDFDISDTDTAEEMMDIVDNLSVQDIADALQAAGYMPEEDATASCKPRRHAMRRKANLEVNWDETSDGDFSSDSFYGEITSIPGYPGGANILIYPSDTPVHINGIECPWHVICTAFPAQTGGEAVDIDCFEIPGFNPTGSSLEDMKQAVENLSLQNFADALEAMGIEPMDED